MSKTKKQMYRMLSLFLALITAFSMLAITASTVTVSAADWSGEVYMINFPRANDPNQSGWGHSNTLYFMDGSVDEPSKKLATHAIGSYNGPTCYCIEPGIGQHTGDTLYQKGEDYWDNYSDNATISRRTIQQLIGQILQYGWTGNNSTEWISTDPVGANELAMERATQILIHEVIVGERREDFSKVNANDYGYNNILEQITPDCPIYAQIMDNYRRIESAVKQHMLRPNFGGTEFELGYDGSKYTVTLTDSNNVLSQYNFSSSSNLSFSKNGNQLTISTNDISSLSMTVKAERAQSKRRAIIVWSDGIVSKENNGQIQDIISYGQNGLPAPH